MWQKLKTIDYTGYLKQLRDVRMIGLLVFGVVVLLVTWSSIGIIQTNYDLQKKIANLQQKVAVQHLENSNLSLRNQYFQTDQYVELQARRQFGRAAPGEKVYVVPRSVALAHSVEPLPTPKAPAIAADEDKPFYQRNFEAWTDFLFRRNHQLLNKS